MANQEGHTDIVSLLLKANANPDLHSDDGVTPLYMASQEGHADIVDLLLEANANVNFTQIRFSLWQARMDILMSLVFF